MAEQDDQEYLEAIKAGDQQALAALYDKYAALMLRVAYRILKSRRDAEDLLHDVFLEAWRRADSYDPRRGTVRNWLLLRVRSRAIDRLRTLGAAHASLLLAGEPDGAVHKDEAAEAADHSQARRALLKLSAAQRVVIELGYFQGMSCREIAERCGIPVGTVKSRLSAAVEKLRQELSSMAEVI